MPELTELDLEGPDSGIRPATRGKRTRRQRIQIALASAALVLAVGVTAWSVFSTNASAIKADVVGFSANGPESISLKFLLAKPAAITVECKVEALANDYAQVGIQTVNVGPADRGQQEVTVQIPTTQLAVSAIVKGCREITP